AAHPRDPRRRPRQLQNDRSCPSPQLRLPDRRHEPGSGWRGGCQGRESKAFDAAKRGVGEPICAANWGYRASLIAAPPPVTLGLLETSPPPPTSPYRDKKEARRPQPPGSSRLRGSLLPRVLPARRRLRGAAG